MLPLTHILIEAGLAACRPLSGWVLASPCAPSSATLWLMHSAMLAGGCSGGVAFPQTGIGCTAQLDSRARTFQIGTYPMHASTLIISVVASRRRVVGCNVIVRGVVGHCGVNRRRLHVVASCGVNRRGLHVVASCGVSRRGLHVVASCGVSTRRLHVVCILWAMSVMWGDTCNAVNLCMSWLLSSLLSSS